MFKASQWHLIGRLSLVAVHQRHEFRHTKTRRGSSSRRAADNPTPSPKWRVACATNQQKRCTMNRRYEFSFLIVAIALLGFSSLIGELLDALQEGPQLAPAGDGVGGIVAVF